VQPAVAADRAEPAGRLRIRCRTPGQARRQLARRQPLRLAFTSWSSRPAPPNPGSGWLRRTGSPAPAQPDTPALTPSPRQARRIPGARRHPRPGRVNPCSPDRCLRACCAAPLHRRSGIRRRVISVPGITGRNRASASTRLSRSCPSPSNAGIGGTAMALGGTVGSAGGSAPVSCTPRTEVVAPLCPQALLQPRVQHPASGSSVAG